MAIDLDGLKEVNDELGHDEGDRLIRETARRMREAFCTEDVVARLGGDEFTLLLADTSPEEACSAVDRLRRATPAGGAFSAGVAFAEPGKTLLELQRRSDLALYEAKVNGGSRTILAGPQLSAPLVPGGADRLPAGDLA